MKKKLGYVGITLMVFGLMFCAWNVYKLWESSESVDATEPNSTITKSHKGIDKMVQKKSFTPEHFSTLNYDFKKGEKVAKLTIPKINSVFTVFWGTDQDTLKKGVGMYVSKWTTIPNPTGGHTVLSGHRDTVFKELRKLQKGDQLSVTFQGDVYSYRIEKIWITDPDDRTVIVKKKQPTLTLTTCYPFDYIGHAPKRYIIETHLIQP